jgi:hypothetical protein
MLPCSKRTPLDNQPLCLLFITAFRHLTPSDHKNRSQLTVLQWCNSRAEPLSL